MSGGIIYQRKVEDKTQGGGAFTFDDVSVDAYTHQITIEITGSPTAGSVQVAGKAPDGVQFINVGTALDISLTHARLEITGHFKALQFTPTGFDGTDFDVIVTSHR